MRRVLRGGDYAVGMRADLAEGEDTRAEEHFRLLALPQFGDFIFYFFQYQDTSRI